MSAAADQLLRWKLNFHNPDFKEIWIKHKEAALTTGAQSFDIDLSKLGTTRIIKEVRISVGADGSEQGADSYAQLHAKITAPAGDDLTPGTSTTLMGESYLINDTSDTCLKMKFKRIRETILDKHYIYMDHAKGSSANVYVSLLVMYK